MLSWTFAFYSTCLAIFFLITVHCRMNGNIFFYLALDWNRSIRSTLSFSIVVQMLSAQSNFKKTLAVHDMPSYRHHMFNHILLKDNNHFYLFFGPLKQRIPISLIPTSQNGLTPNFGSKDIPLLMHWFILVGLVVKFEKSHNVKKLNFKVRGILVRKTKWSQPVQKVTVNGRLPQAGWKVVE